MRDDLSNGSGGNSGMVTSPGVASLSEGLAGVTTALVTPISLDGSVDLAALDQHVKFQVAHGVRVLATAGTLGEYPLLNRAERAAIASAVSTAGNGRAQVLVGVSDEDPREMRMLASDAADAGAHGLLVSPPAHYALSQDEQLLFWQWWDENTPLPYVIYNAIGSPTARPQPALIARLAELDNAAGVKDASGDVRRIGEIVEALAGRKPLLAASEITAPWALQAGADGLMTTTACFAPDLLQRLVDAAERGDRDGIAVAHAAIRRIRRPFQDQMDSGYPAFIAYTKAACDLVGLPAGPPRAPLRGLTAQETATLRSVLEAELGADALGGT